MNKEKYEKIQMDVVELKEDVIVTSCPVDWGVECNSDCGRDGASQCNCPIYGIGGNNTTICVGADGGGCRFVDMGTGCSPVSCSEESISPGNPKP